MTPVRQSNRAFGLMMAVVFAAIAAAAWLVFDAPAAWPFAVAALFLACALAAPWVLLPLNRLWGGFAHRLGRFNNFLLLGLFFYLFILPVGGLLRLFGWDPMKRTPEAKSDSYWTPVERHTDPETFRDMF